MLKQDFRVEKLPPVEIMVPLGEIELTFSYADPALQHLVTNYHYDTKLIWPNLTQKKSLLSNNNVNKSRRPDAVLRILDHRVYSPSRGFGEIKTKERTDEKFELTRDLVRGIIFAKESIDISNMTGNIFFQVIGNHFICYLITLEAEGIYTSVEICDLYLPMSLTDLPRYVTELSKLIQIQAIYENIYVQSEKTIDIQNKRTTLDKPIFRSYINAKKFQT